MVSKEDLLARLDQLLGEAAQAGELPQVQAHAAAYRLESEAPDDASVGDVLCKRQPLEHGMVGESPQIKRIHLLLDRLAPTDVTVLVLGDTGTGKELIAKALHAGSPRKSKRLLAENCAAVPAELLESELFGHTRGSFTGAVGDRDGHFVAADGGTMFLDEIGEMPLAMQAKLLRVLQEGEVRPVGSNKTVQVNVRVVAATNKNLEESCAVGDFREDLYWRLAVVTMQLPPLREREGDVRRLTLHLLACEGESVGTPVRISEEAIALLESQPWPGNVRQLENELRRAVALCEVTQCESNRAERRIGIENLSPGLLSS
jgi:transcriptional regulator with GAF, ATPase, and Fis domain